MNSAIAQRLRELRKRLGFDRRSDMAQHLGLPNSTYSAYEGDAGPPKVEWLVELAHRGVNLNWLLTGEGEMMLPPHMVAIAATPATGRRAEAADLRGSELNTYLLAAMIHHVERDAQERGQPLTPMEKGERAARLYAASARVAESELASQPPTWAADGSER
ncbi:helix-turn-helix domain-containing protein [Niveispirillum sp. KHB5.9]|uniref:helix-turn-helix domain-containing protein n=1 Tax=Niveispirillum sp. KHB5.9 TaxID=3400269 RepID=UPI003A8934BE